VDLNHGNSSVLLGHPWLVDTMSSAIQSRLICCLWLTVPLVTCFTSSQEPSASLTRPKGNRCNTQHHKQFARSNAHKRVQTYRPSLSHPWHHTCILQPDGLNNYGEAQRRDYNTGGQWQKALPTTITSPLGQLIYFVGPNNFIPGLLGFFCCTGSRICFSSWWWLGERKEKLHLWGFHGRRWWQYCNTSPPPL
jgi:hypothetical protein